MRLSHFSVAHRAEIGEEVKTPVKEPRKLGPPDSTIPFQPDGTTVQMRGDSSVVENGSMGTLQ